MSVLRALSQFSSKKVFLKLELPQEYSDNLIPQAHFLTGDS